jgi:hypothetical protein
VWVDAGVWAEDAGLDFGFLHGVVPNLSVRLKEMAWCRTPMTRRDPVQNLLG